MGFKKIVTLATVIVILIVACTAVTVLNVNDKVFASEANEIMLDSALGSSAEVDYSSYTDKTLPETINAKNIDQYVPSELFNTSDTVIWNGKNYGFIYKNYQAVNYVLLFKVTMQRNPDGFGYSKRINVIFTGKYSKTLLGINNISTPYNISLSNIRFDQTIINQTGANNLAGDYSMEEDDGAYFINSRYNYNGTVKLNSNWETVNDVAQEMLVGASVAIASLIPVAGPVIAAMVPYVVSSIEYLSEEKYLPVTDSVINTDYDFPLTKEAQLQNGRLLKNLSLSITTDTVLRDGNLAESVFRIANPNNIGYIVNSDIKFDIVMFTSTNLQFGVETDKKISQQFNYTEIITESNEIKETDGAFEVIENKYVVLNTKGVGVKFIPDETAVYKFNSLFGSKIYLKDMVYSQDSKYLLTKDATYYLSVVPNTMPNSTPTWSGNSSEELFTNDMYYDKERIFDNINITKDQSFAQATRTSVAFEKVESNQNKNDVYKLIPQNSDINDFQLYILDKDLNVVNTGLVGTDGCAYINYAFLANSENYVVVIPNGNNYVIQNEGQLATSESLPITGDGHLFYLLDIPYTQLYVFNKPVSRVFNNSVELTSENGGYRIPKGLYGVKTTATGSNLKVSVNPTNILNVSFGNPIGIKPIYTTMLWHCTVSANYTVGTKADVYNNGVLVSSGTTFYAQAGKSYHLVTTEEGNLKIEFALNRNTSAVKDEIVTINAGVNVFKFNIAEQFRFDISAPSATVTLVNSEGNTIIKGLQGYKPTVGEYFIIIDSEEASTFNVYEAVYDISITLNNEGDTSSVVGKYDSTDFTLPTPDTRINYVFNGWRTQYGTMITDSTGAVISSILQDEITLYAEWVIQKLVLKVEMSNLSYKWWGGTSLEDSQPSQALEGNVYSMLANLHNSYINNSNGKKTGYFLKSFDVELVSRNNDVDTILITPVWEIERYLVCFNYFDASSSLILMEYNQPITSSSFPVTLTSITVFGYNNEYWQNDVDQVIDLTGTKMPDLNSNEGRAYNYDYDNDGVYDCTRVNLYLVTSLKDITINIGNKTVKTNVEDGYEIQKLTNYVDNISSYYGYNVLFEYIYSGVKTTYTEYSDISFGTSYNMNINIVKTPLYVDLSYGSSGSGNPSSFLLFSNDVILSNNNTFSRYEDFVSWTYNGQDIDRLKSSMFLKQEYYSEVQNVPRYSAYISSRYNSVSITNKAYSTTTLTDSAIKIYQSNAILERGITYNISSSVNKVTFYGSSKQWSDFQINVSSRGSKTLYLNFDNVNAMGVDSYSLINAPTANIVLFAYNTNLEGGNASIKYDNNPITAVVHANNLTLSGVNLNTYTGGQALLFSDSFHEQGGYGIYCNGDLTIEGGEHIIKGGAGKDGAHGISGTEMGEDGTHASNGTHGGMAVFARSVKINRGWLTLQGGDGGNGGNGGNGADGRDGKGFGPITINPGNGGNGGNGGNAGKACNVNVQGPQENIILIENGKSGNGGKGGKPGNPSYTMWGNQRNGEKGTDGTNGRYA